MAIARQREEAIINGHFARHQRSMIDLCSLPAGIGFQWKPFHHNWRYCADTTFGDLRICKLCEHCFGKPPPPASSLSSPARISNLILPVCYRLSPDVSDVFSLMLPLVPSVSSKICWVDTIYWSVVFEDPRCYQFTFYQQLAWSSAPTNNERSRELLISNINYQWILMPN